MKPQVLRAEDARPGMVLSRGAGALQKGAVLTAEQLEALRGRELHVIEMEPGELHEDAAGWRVAAMMAGEGLTVQPLSGGNWPLAAQHRGLVALDEVKLAALNESDEIAVVTAPAGQVVLQGEIVARVKIIPFVAREDEVRRAETLGAAVRVRPFLPMRVAALVQDGIDDEGLAKFRAAFAEKLAFFGSPPPQVERAPGELLPAVKRCIAQGAQLVAMAGSKLMDPHDPAASALAPHVQKHGIPVHPGTLLWVAEVDGVPVIGAPGCALFSKATAFDVLLAHVLAGERLTRAMLARLGAGGLLTKDLAFRLPPYRPDLPRGELPP